MTHRIRIVDLETTGFAPPEHAPPEHAPCEIAYCDLITNETDLAGAPINWHLAGGEGYLCHPGRNIPPETSAIHHIIDADVEGLMTWPEIAEGVIGPSVIKATAYAAHNAKFERQWITDDLTGGAQWICTYKCALRLWPEAPSHSNQALRYWRDPVGLSRAVANKSHRAYPDAYVTAFLLRDMLQLASVEQLIEWTNEPALLLKIKFGKYKGQRWSVPPTDYLEWILRDDFDEDVKFTVRHELTRRAAARPSPLAGEGGAQAPDEGANLEGNAA